MSQKNRQSWPHLWNSIALERRRMRDTEDNLATARCPVCRHPLVAMNGKHGPYFYCGCEEKGKAVCA